MEQRSFGTPDELGLKSISPQLGYWPASAEPLCADIFVYRGLKGLWLFDIGYGDKALERVRALLEPCRVVISHFHQDHMGNLPQTAWDELYAGQYTLRHIKGAGQAVTSPMEPEPGVRLFPIPSCHAKGCIGMEIEGTYALLGDATYCTSRTPQGRPAYNATLLLDTIRTLEGLKAPWFLLSHGEPLVRPREEILGELREIYRMRTQGEAYIFVE